MLAKINKIDQLKSSRNAGQTFTRVHLQIKNLDGSYSYAHTDLVPTFRNYARWKDLLRVGNILGNLTQLKNGKIDSDSYPKFVGVYEPGAVTVPKILEKKVETKKLF